MRNAERGETAASLRLCGLPRLLEETSGHGTGCDHISIGHGKGEVAKIQWGTGARARLQKLAHPQEAARQASEQRSKGMTSSDWARLFGYQSESSLPAKHSSGRRPGDNTQNQA